MMRNPPDIRRGASAALVVSYIAEIVLGAGWSMNFNIIDQAIGTEGRADPSIFRFWKNMPWWMNWGGIVHEAELTEDATGLMSRLLSHDIDVETAGASIVPTETVRPWLEERLPSFGGSGPNSLVVCSRCDNSIQVPSRVVKHIPMMDFRCEPSDRNLELVITAMRQVDQEHGVIMASGRSYHYYGFELLTETQWYYFMYKSLLLSPFTDSRYIGHRLIAGTARLRISASKTKKQVPKVVAVI